MALQKTNVSLSFKQGLDTKTDPKQVVFGKLLNLQNGKFISPTQIKKRNGYAQVGPALPGSNGVDVISYNHELVSYDGEQVYSYSTETNTQVLKGNKLAVDLEATPIIRNNYNQVAPDYASHPSGLEMYVYSDSQDSTVIKFSLIDTTTGNFISRDVTLVTGFYNWRVGVVGNYFVVTYTDSAGANLYYKAMNIATPGSFLISGTLTTTLATYYDFCLLGTKLYFIYSETSSRIAYFSLDSTLVQSAIVHNTKAYQPLQCTVFADSVLNEIYWAYQGSDFGIYFQVTNTNFVSIGSGGYPGDGNVYSITGSAYNGIGKLFYDNLTYVTTYGITPLSSPAPISSIVACLNVLRTGGAAPFSYKRGIRISSKSFTYGGHVFCPTVYISTQQTTYFVLDENCSVITKIAYGNSSYVSRNCLSNSVATTITDFSFPYLYKDLTTSINAHIYTQAGINKATLTFNSLLDNKILANDIHTSGGILSMYDGANVVEHGFNLYPENLYNVQSPNSGALSAGQYQYSAVYEWMDNEGNVHKSAPSTPLTVVNGPIKFFGNQTSGGAIITSFSSYTNLYVGMLITGSGVPTNTRIVSISPTQIFISNNVTSSVTGNSYTVTPLESFTTTNPAGTQLTFIGKDQMIFYGQITTLGVNYFDAYSTANILPGMTIDCPWNTGASGLFNTGPAIVDYIVGNRVYIKYGVDTNVAGLNLAMTASIRIYGTAISGSPTITATNQDYRTLVVPGNRIETFSGGFTGIRTVVSVTATSITLDANASASASINCYKILPVSYFVKPGMEITSTNAALTGIGVAVLSIVDNLDGTGIVNLRQDVSGNYDNSIPPTSGSVTFDIATLYSSLVGIPTLRLTDKIATASKVILSVYRTEANQSTFYRCTSLITPIFNDVTVDYIWFTDTVADWVLIGNDQLYTTGGEVENIAAPATSIMTSFKNRLIAVPQENKFQFWYSKQVIPGSPVEFSDVFVQNVDQRGGEITALGVMDDKLIIFKQNSIYYIVGDGPTPAGTFNDFSLPILITSDAGCSNKKSIVVMPEGLMFKSSKGIYLLSRALELKYIGADVEAYNAFDVTSAQLIPTVYEVRFTLTNGVCLVHDYYVDQWSVYTNIAAVDATIFQNKYTYLKANGVILQETPGSYTDNGSFIQLLLTTSWNSFAGLQGYERFYDMLILGDYKSPHTLNIDFSYNFDNSTVQNTQIPVLTDPGVYQYRVFPVTQKCEAFKLSIYDTQDASFGEGFDISAIIMRIGIKQGTQKMPATSAFS